MSGGVKGPGQLKIGLMQFCGQTGNGQNRVCQDRKPDWVPVPPPTFHPHPPTPSTSTPRGFSHNDFQPPPQHLNVHCCIHMRPCVFPVFIPPAIPSLFTQSCCTVAGGGQVSAVASPPTSVMWHRNRRYAEISRKCVKSAFMVSVACDRWSETPL